MEPSTDIPPTDVALAAAMRVNKVHNCLHTVSDGVEALAFLPRGASSPTRRGRT